MTSYSIGQFVGSIMGVALLTMCFKFILRRVLGGTQLILAAVGSSVATATFLYAFGSANGGPPEFGEGFAQYGIGGVIVMLIWLLAVRGRNSANG